MSSSKIKVVVKFKSNGGLRSVWIDDQELKFDGDKAETELEPRSESYELNWKLRGSAPNSDYTVAILEPPSSKWSEPYESDAQGDDTGSLPFFIKKKSKKKSKKK